MIRECYRGWRVLTGFAVFRFTTLLLGQVYIVDVLATVDVLNKSRLRLHLLKPIIGFLKPRQQHLAKSCEIVHKELYKANESN